MSKRKNNYLFLASFLTPFLILLILWLLLGLAPFGNNNLLVSDLGTQYLPFLSAFKQFFENGNLSTYSFSNGIGGSILALIAYYVISPFNFIVLLFPYSQLPVAILLIITLKISCMGTSMFYYLRKTYGTIPNTTLLFSTSYSLCGFVIAYSLNFMWLDALILLPLLALGIQQLWDKKKWVLYSGALFATIVTNYYMGYMVCIFAVCYSVYWYYIHNKSHTKRVINFFKEGKLFFLCSFLTGISTSFILLPAIEGMLQTKKNAFDFSTFIPTPKFGLAFFSQFGLGTVNFDLRLDHLPTVFSGILMTLLFITYFQLKTRSKKEKKASAFLIGFIFLSFWIEGISTVWHMFQNPAGFPYRNSFIFSFLLIKLAFEAYLELEKGAKLSFKVPIIFSIFLSVGQLALILFDKDLLLSNNYFFLTLLLIWIFYFLLTCTLKREKVKKGVLLLLSVLVFFELGVNYWISLKDIPFGNQQKFSETYQQQSLMINNLKENKSELFRMKQTLDSKQAGYSEKNNGYNNSILYGYAGVSSYTSTLEASTQDSLNTLGLYAKNDRRIGYVDNSQVINLLLNVPYEITPEKQTKEPLKTVDDISIYENTEAIGMGFLTSPTLKNLDLTHSDPLKNHELILQQIQESQESYFIDVDKQNSQTSIDSYDLTVKVAATGDLYSYIPHINWKNVTAVEINGQQIKPTIAIATNQLFNFGFFEKNQLVTIKIYSKQKLDLTDWSLQTLDQKKFDSLITKEKELALSLHELGGNQYTGEVTVQNEEESLLYLSIPFDKNWTVKLDGETVDTFAVLENFTGILLTEGTHQLTLSYHQKSLDLGIFISIFILFVVSFYQLVKWLRKKKSRLF